MHVDRMFEKREGERNMENNIEKIVLLCEDDLESMYSAIYEAFMMKSDPKNTHIQLDGQESMEFFTEYIYVDRDEEKAQKVAKALVRRFGYTVYEHLTYILCHESERRVDVFYHVIELGLGLKYPETIFSHLGNPWVMEGFEMKRKASREIFHLFGFLRFEELKNGVLFARIHPKTDVILFLARHFADRLPSENFIIYDEKREKCIVHPYRGEWYLRTKVKADMFQETEASDAQQLFEKLFQEFCRTIAIKERKNEKLQQNMLPLHFRDCMVEFSGDASYVRR